MPSSSTSLHRASVHRALITLAALLLLPSMTLAQSAPTLDDLAWMVGRWTADLGEGRMAEEITAAEAGGMLVSMFRVTKGETTVALELIVFRETSDGIEMRYRHFDSELKAIETAPSVMRLVAREGQDWIFTNADPDQPRRSLLRLQSDGRMYFRAELGPEGSVRVIEITMRKDEG